MAQTSDITISRVLVVRVSRTFVLAQGRTRRTETVILQEHGRKTTKTSNQTKLTRLQLEKILNSYVLSSSPVILHPFKIKRIIMSVG
jgi:hypothetical protein